MKNSGDGLATLSLASDLASPFGMWIFSQGRA